MLPGSFAPDDPRADDVRSLLATHLAFNQAQSPPEDCHTLDVDQLAGDDVLFFSYRVDGELVAVGALKVLDDEHVELKSMHTVAAARGQGIGAAMVDHLLGVAGARGARRVSLETGSMEAFGPARALYARAGFEECAAYGDYRPSANSTFMTRTLDRPPQVS